MPRKLAILLGSTLLATGLVLSDSYAEDQQGTPHQEAPSGHGMMGQGMGGMMGNQEMMAQMQRMMENCNKMMESHMQKDNAPTPPQDKKG